MSCSKFMITDVFTLPDNILVGAGLDLLLKNQVRSMPVVDLTGVYLGMFNFRTVIGSLLPASARAIDGVKNLRFIEEDTGFIIGRLGETKAKKITEIMRKDVFQLNPDTSLEHSLLQLYLNDTPLPIVDSVTNVLLGLFTKQSAISALMK